MELEQGTAAKRYTELEASRRPFLDRARECSKFTIPALLPPEGANSTSKLHKPYQSIGARGVNNLAGKLVMALLPPTQAFFKLKATIPVRTEVEQKVKDEIDNSLSAIEQLILGEMESRAIRVFASEAFKHLIVAGNVLLHVPKKKKGIRVFPLHQYVVLRDGEGNPLEIIVKERVSWRILPVKDGFRDAIKTEVTTADSQQRNVDLYTSITLDDNDRWHVHQEVCGKEVPDSRGDYPADKLPWLPLRWTRIDGEDYGRSHCDDFIGDLLSLEGLSEAIVQASAAAARVLFLVAPNSTLDEKELEEAPNLAVRSGHKDEVTVVSLEKFADMQIAKTTMDGIEGRLSYGFLMNSSIQRQAERVTAEEIRFMANELENQVGGVYSILSAEFQLPLVSVVKAYMEAAGEIPKLGAKDVTTAVVTGLDALGRNQDLMRLDAFIDGIEQRFPEAGQQRINISAYLKRRASAIGVEDNGLIYTEEEVAAKAQASQQAQQQFELAKAATPNAVKAVGDSVNQQPTGEQPAQ